MVDAADTPALAVLTRAPSSGGKTRLFRALGIPPDPDLLTAMLLDTLDGVAAPGLRRLVAVTPASACGELRTLVGDAEVIAQPDGDLGMRMRETMAALFARGAPAVALIGSDLPHIPATVIAEACSRVTADPDGLVLGPASDGGYYLIAAGRVPDVFTGITWGSAEVLAQTAQAAVADGLRVSYLPTMSDVDTPDDLHAAARSGRARRTAAWWRTRAARLQVAAPPGRKVDSKVD
ncbi:MAG: TIGR04282 family arsenosugar biosynthesis glycosyltransferase [Acidobacteria bacterium]|nr:TIGR04282 family arsenosugar biosynthesis glycosyltransferase [Acidobacteriota bacterium]